VEPGGSKILVFLITGTGGYFLKPQRHLFMAFLSTDFLQKKGEYK
jgi:hypothetical protein